MIGDSMDISVVKVCVQWLRGYVPVEPYGVFSSVVPGAIAPWLLAPVRSLFLLVTTSGKISTAKRCYAKLAEP
jgi:hypothetical protein